MDNPVEDLISHPLVLRLVLAGFKIKVRVALDGTSHLRANSARLKIEFPNNLPLVISPALLAIQKKDRRKIKAGDGYAFVNYSKIKNREIAKDAIRLLEDSQKKIEGMLRSIKDIQSKAQALGSKYVRRATYPNNLGMIISPMPI
jgi:hypothetical protein